MTQELQVLDLVTRAFSEVASSNMKKTRSGVLENRDFITDISKIFEDVRAEYAKENLKNATSSKITFLAHNGKTVSVLLSSTSGLYGEIVAETFDIFKGEVRKDASEVTIVGKQGIRLFTSIFPGKAYTFFDMDDTGSTQSQLSDLARHIVQYDEIHLFYGKFHSVLVQKPEMLPIRSQIDIAPIAGDRIHYLFEPDLISILRFFESELFASLLTQTVQESTLAKMASRVLAMDASSARISLERKRLSKLENTLRHREDNKKQLNNLSAILNVL
jgi:ATP synthase F1 gamma subunit